MRALFCIAFFMCKAKCGEQILPAHMINLHTFSRTQNRQFQEINLGWCRYDFPSVVHELLHALGVNHEQTRHDRDSYIKLNWTAIGNWTYQFKVREDINSRNIPYDFLSIMHYSEWAGIIALPGYERYQSLMGRGHRMSAKDVELLNLMYRCPINGE